jgi:O-antigen/teichoic acid export membrane protein
MRAASVYILPTAFMYSVTMKCCKDMDAHGHKRMSLNIISSWGAFSLQVLSGFVVPRIIDSKLGQDQLGVWDFAWTVVAYFGLIHVGVASSINRYVALYKSMNDEVGVSRVVSTSTAVMGVIGGAILAVSFFSAYYVPVLFHKQLSMNIHEVRWLIFLLGASMAVQVALAPFGGVLTGCHRWDLHNGIHALSNILTFLAMLLSLLYGGGLIGLGVSVLLCEGGGWVARWILAYGISPGLRLRLHYCDVGTAKEMILFGGKTFIPRVGDLLLNQTISVFILASMGTAALALYSRPRALIRSVFTLMTKYAQVLVPTTSSLHAVGDSEQIRKLFIQSSTYSNCLCLPIMLFIGIMGEELLSIWMGARYSNGLLIMAMALGQIVYVANTPVVFMLSGLDLHGRPGVITFLAQCSGLALAYAVLKFSNAGLPGVAVAVGLPLSITNGVYIPWYACKKIKLKKSTFFWYTWKYSLFASFPFVLCLVLIKQLFPGNALLKLVLACVCGSMILGVLYWQWVLSEKVKERIRGGVVGCVNVSH